MDRLPGRDSRIVGEVKYRPKLPSFIKLPKLKKKTMLIGLGLTFVIVVGAGSLYFIRDSQDRDNEERRYSTMIKEVDDDLKNGHKEEAKSKLQAFLKTNPKSQEYRYNANVRLAGIYYDLGDYKTARHHGEEAMSQGKSLTHDVYVQLGDSALKLNDKKGAIDYYQKAINELAKDQNVSNSSRIYSLQTIIGELRAGNP